MSFRAGIALALLVSRLVADSGLSASLDAARHSYQVARASEARAESLAAPLAESVRQLKAVRIPGGGHAGACAATFRDCN